MNGVLHSYSVASADRTAAVAAATSSKKSTYVAETCWSSQPASANIFLGVASRCRLSPPYLPISSKTGFDDLARDRIGR